MVGNTSLYRLSAGRAFWLAIRETKKLGPGHMSRKDVWYMVRRRAVVAGLDTKIRCHTFRATGITDYLTNGGRFLLIAPMKATTPLDYTRTILEQARSIITARIHTAARCFRGLSCGDHLRAAPGNRARERYANGARWRPDADSQ
jgi:integrase